MCATVVECVELEQTRLPGAGHYLNLRGEVLPYVRREKVVVARYGAQGRFGGE